MTNNINTLLNSLSNLGEIRKADKNNGEYSSESDFTMAVGTPTKHTFKPTGFWQLYYELLKRYMTNSNYGTKLCTIDVSDIDISDINYFCVPPNNSQFFYDSHITEIKDALENDSEKIEEFYNYIRILGEKMGEQINSPKDKQQQDIFNFIFNDFTEIFCNGVYNMKYSTKLKAIFGWETDPHRYIKLGFGVFQFMTCLTEIKGLYKWATILSTNNRYYPTYLAKMFFCCTNLQYIEPSFIQALFKGSFINSNAQLDAMFAGCFNLKSIGDLSYLRFEGCANLMFFGCQSLNLNFINRWSKLIPQQSAFMFGYCNQLITVTLKTNGALTAFYGDIMFGYMFYGCQNLVKLDLGNVLDGDEGDGSDAKMSTRKFWWMIFTMANNCPKLEEYIVPHYKFTEKDIYETPSYRVNIDGYYSSVPDFRQWLGPNWGVGDLTMIPFYETPNLKIIDCKYLEFDKTRTFKLFQQFIRYNILAAGEFTKNHKGCKIHFMNDDIICSMSQLSKLKSSDVNL